jgi:hypothetical protein
VGGFVAGWLGLGGWVACQPAVLAWGEWLAGRLGLVWVDGCLVARLAGLVVGG